MTTKTRKTKKVQKQAPISKNLVLVGVVFIILAGVIFFGMQRARMTGGSPGGLAAVSVDGNPIPPSAALAAASSLPKNAAIQESGGMQVSLALNPYPPNGAGDFDVTLADTNGQAISDASVSLDLSMPAMRMPANQLNMQAGADGKYHASGYFTMRGLWRIEVIINRGGQTQSVYFNVGL